MPPVTSASGTDALPNPTRLQLDAETGFNCLCRSIRISDGMGNILEEIDNYNTMVAMKYDYDSNVSLRNKRALTEGCTAFSSDHRSTNSGTKPAANVCVNNPYVKDDLSAVRNASFNKDNFIDCKVCVPLHTGIFQNDKIFPNMLLQNGLIITILLEDNNRVFRQLDTDLRYRRLLTNPEFKGKTSAGASIGAGTLFNTVYFKTTNSIHTAASSLPFVVGEKFGFQRWVNGGSIAEFRAAEGVPTVKEVSVDAGYVKVELNASVFNANASIDAAALNFAYSRSVGDSTNYDVTYIVSDVNLICQSVNMPMGAVQKIQRDMTEGGVKEYDFMSATCYKYSQLASDRVANIPIPINESRSLALFCIPTDATVYSTKEALNACITYKIDKTETVDNIDYYLRSNRSGLEGISDFLTNYQFLYNGRLQPNRSISTKKTSSSAAIDQQPLIELQKALAKIGIQSPSFNRFNQNFMIGRALAIGEGKVYDGVGKDFNLQVNYNETDAPTKNKLWCMYNFHIRRLVFRQGDLQVER